MSRLPLSARPMGWFGFDRGPMGNGAGIAGRTRVPSETYLAQRVLIALMSRRM